MLSKIEFKQFPVALRSTGSSSSHENEVREFVWGKTIRKKPKLRIVHTNKNFSPKLFCFVSSVVSWGFPYIGVEPVVEVIQYSQISILLCFVLIAFALIAQSVQGSVGNLIKEYNDTTQFLLNYQIYLWRSQNYVQVISFHRIQVEVQY